MKSSILVLAALALGLSGLQAQAPAAKVDIKKPKVNLIPTPLFQAGNVPDKRWVPKNWLEVDMEFDVKVPAAAGGNKGSLSAVIVHYYLATSGTSADGKRQVLKGSITYSDVPAGGEKCHALGFVAPSTLRRVLGSDNYTNADIVAWGVEVVVDGQLLAGDTSGGGKWWETNADKLSISEGSVVAKLDTPFAILWGDYDVVGKSK